MYNSLPEKQNRLESNAGNNDVIEEKLKSSSYTSSKH